MNRFRYSRDVCNNIVSPHEAVSTPVLVGRHGKYRQVKREVDKTLTPSADFTKLTPQSSKADLQRYTKKVLCELIGPSSITNGQWRGAIGKGRL